MESKCIQIDSCAGRKGGAVGRGRVKWGVSVGSSGRRQGEGAEGGTQCLINHSCIVIDFLFRAVSQTLNFVSACVL